MPPSVQRPTQLLQPNSRVASATNLYFFLHTRQGAPKQKAVVIFSRLSKSTHRSWTIFPLMNIASSFGGNHPRLMPSSLIFHTRYLVEPSVAKGMSRFRRSATCGSMLEFSAGLVLQKKTDLTPNPEFEMCTLECISRHPFCETCDHC